MIDIDYKNLKYILPYFGGFLIGLGYLKLTLFYNHFNITISEYIDISEMLTGFIPDLLMYCSVFFFILILNFLVISESELFSSDDNINKVIKIESFFKRFFEFFKQNLLIFCILIIVVIINLFRYRNFNQNLYYIFLGMVLIFKFILIEYNRKHKLLYKKYLSSSSQNFILIFFSLIICVFYINYTDIEIIKKGNNLDICFNFTDKVVQTDSNLIFIGQTNKFLFLYDKVSNETTVYNREKVENIIIREIKKR